MVGNLRARGCALAGAEHCANAAAACGRLEAAGWAGARCRRMDAVWAALPSADRARAEALEPLDEHELLHQLHTHYALTLAHTADLFADMEPGAFA